MGSRIRRSTNATLVSMLVSLGLLCSAWLAYASSAPAGTSSYPGTTTTTTTVKATSTTTTTVPCKEDDRDDEKEHNGDGHNGDGHKGDGHKGDGRDNVKGKTAVR